MFNSKYSKVLTIILIVAIVVILGLLIFMGFGWYQSYISESDVNEVLGEFDDYVSNIQSGSPSTGENQNNVTGSIEPNIDLNNNVVGQQTGGSSTQQLTYKGFKVVGRIQIPKTDVDYPILEKVSPKSIEASIGMLYGPGINQVGNTVLIGHNFRNGTFFSNNSKLSNGDKIYLTDMQGNKVTYEIYHKYQADSNDFDYAVRDTKGKREISLSTCTNDTKYRLIIWAKEV